MQAVSQTARALEFAAEELKDDRNFMLKAVSEDPGAMSDICGACCMHTKGVMQQHATLGRVRRRFSTLSAGNSLINLARRRLLN